MGCKMKHKNIFYLQLSREIFTEEYNHLSINAKWLFIVLNELEHKFTGTEKDYFFRSNEDLCIDTGLGLSTLKKVKKELLETDLVQTWQSHFVDKTGKKSEKRITVYRIKK